MHYLGALSKARAIAFHSNLRCMFSSSGNGRPANPSHQRSRFNNQVWRSRSSIYRSSYSKGYTQ
ncbi:MAG: hypothetical protein SFY66_11215 [Oculatellaceae cyanobacterium bins.114]|nr:hypothetical protein [Oculatellaceae cyanobacterium bins.114]